MQKKPVVSKKQNKPSEEIDEEFAKDLARSLDDLKKDRVRVVR